jgi:hypothetical protein
MPMRRNTSKRQRRWYQLGTPPNRRIIWKDRPRRFVAKAVSGANSALNLSIEIWRTVLRYRPRDRVPLAWGMTQNSLGTVLSTLGSRETRTRLIEAVATLPRGARGIDARSRAGRLGRDATLPRERAGAARRAGGRRRAPDAGGRSLSGGAGGTETRPAARRLGDNHRQSRNSANVARATAW